MVEVKDTYTRPLSMITRLIIHVVELWCCERQLDELNGSSSENRVQSLGAGSTNAPHIDDVDLVTLVEKPRSPPFSTIWFVEPLL